MYERGLSLASTHKIAVLTAYPSCIVIDSWSPNVSPKVVTLILNSRNQGAEKRNDPLTLQTSLGPAKMWRRD
jgi:hypothetical protein